MDPSTSCESSWNRGQFVEEDTSCLSGSGPHRTPGSGAKPAGRQPHRPSRSRPSLPGQGSKRQSLASRRSDPISALPAGLLGPPAPGRDAHFHPSPELGDLAISAQLGNRDAVQTPPLAPLESSSPRCQLAADFDPILSRLREGSDSDGKLQERNGPEARPPRPQLRGDGFGVSSSLRKLHRN